MAADEGFGWENMPLRVAQRTRFTPNDMTADFRVLPYVKQVGAPVETRATFVEDRRPGLHRA